MDDEDVYSIVFVFFLNFFFFFIVYKDHSMNFATFIFLTIICIFKFYNITP